MLSASLQGLFPTLKPLKVYSEVVFFFELCNLCAASSDATARLWQLASGEAIKVYQGHLKATVCCALHDGNETTPA